MKIVKEMGRSKNKPARIIFLISVNKKLSLFFMKNEINYAIKVNKTLRPSEKTSIERSF